MKELTIDTYYRAILSRMDEIDKSLIERNFLILPRYSIRESFIAIAILVSLLYLIFHGIVIIITGVIALSVYLFLCFKNTKYLNKLKSIFAVCNEYRHSYMVELSTLRHSNLSDGDINRINRQISEIIRRTNDTDAFMKKHLGVSLYLYMISFNENDYIEKKKPSD